MIKTNTQRERGMKRIILTAALALVSTNAWSVSVEEIASECRSRQGNDFALKQLSELMIGQPISMSASITEIGAVYASESTPEPEAAFVFLKVHSNGNDLPPISIYASPEEAVTMRVGQESTLHANIRDLQFDHQKCSEIWLENPIFVNKGTNKKQPEPSREANSEANAPSIPFRASTRQAHAETIEILMQAGIDYKDLAVGFMFFELGVCHQIAEGNAFKRVRPPNAQFTGKPKKTRRQPEIYDRIMEAQKVWDYSVTSFISSLGEKKAKSLLQKFEQLGNIEQFTAGLSGMDQTGFPPGLEARAHTEWDTWSESPTALKRCADTMPRNTRNAHTRYGKWKRLTKKSMKGDTEAFRKFDSVLIDMLLGFEKVALSYSLELG